MQKIYNKTGRTVATLITGHNQIMSHCVAKKLQMSFLTSPVLHLSCSHLLVRPNLHLILLLSQLLMTILLNSVKPSPTTHASSSSNCAVHIFTQLPPQLSILMPSSHYQHTSFQLCDFWTHCMGTIAPSEFLDISKIFRRFLTWENFTSTTEIASLVARECVGHLSQTLGTKLCNALRQKNFCFSRKWKIFF